ncbi:MAG: fumarylacetoacetate hydrolase family protein [Actinomycetota bacterium]
MSPALFRLRLVDGSYRLAIGSPGMGPRTMLEPHYSLDRLLAERTSLAGLAFANEEPVPDGARVVAPVESQEVWGAGVTYVRSRDARREEAVDPTPYDHVYEAERPELFFKAPGWRCVGPGEPIAIRRDSTWNVPEPELTLVLDAGLRIAGYTVGNDVSSRSIEGESALYLPQAKSYERSCSLGPCIVPVEDVAEPFRIRLEISREDRIVFAEETSTQKMKRGFDELARWLANALTFPAGVLLLSGTGIVPEPTFTLERGDVVRIGVEGLGTLANPVVEVGEVPA